MSSQNSNNEFEGLDDPFGASGMPSDDFQEDMPFGTDPGVPEGDAENLSPAPEEGGINFSEQPADGENPDAMLNPEDAQQDLVEEVTVEYKKAPCWDLFSWLLLISWLTLLGAILFLWLECPSSEYGEPPYKESSVPVKTATP